MAKKDSLKLDGLKNVHDNAIQPPSNQVISREYRKRGAIEHSKFQDMVHSEPDQTYDQMTHEYYLAHRADRYRVKPRNWLMKTAGKFFTPLDYATNPEILVTDEEEKFHVEQFNRESEGFLTRWENVNRMTYPKEAFEMMQTEAFREWWYHDPDGYAVPDGPSVVTEMDGSGWPELILHGTFAVIDREKGFVQMNLKDTDKFGKEFEEQEIGPHMGTPGQALDILYGKEYGNKDVMTDGGVLPTRQQFKEAVKGQTPFAPQARWYPGFVKMNNPLIINEEKYNWHFDVIMKHLASENSGQTEYDPETGHAIRNYGTTKPSLLSQHKDDFGNPYTYSIDSQEYGVNNPTTIDMGSGTALDQILKYAIEIADEEGKDISDVNWEAADDKGMDKETGKDISLAYKADVEYYRLKGLMRFLQDDLGYDGIKYWNQVEDKGAPDWSYILFSPNQFKSIYNEGSFEWGTREEPHRDFMTQTNKNKYRKVS